MKFCLCTFQIQKFKFDKVLEMQDVNGEIAQNV